MQYLDLETGKLPVCLLFGNSVTSTTPGAGTFIGGKKWTQKLLDPGPCDGNTPRSSKGS